jgi:hypothetical protein
MVQLGDRVTCVQKRFILIKFNKPNLNMVWETNHKENSIKRMVEEEYGSRWVGVRLRCSYFS